MMPQRSWTSQRLLICKDAPVIGLHFKLRHLISGKFTVSYQRLAVLTQ
jgi:hypothetical protein